MLSTPSVYSIPPHNECMAQTATCSNINNGLCGGAAFSDMKVQYFISKLQSFKKFFAHRSAYHTLVSKVQELTFIHSPEERLITFMDILDPEQQHDSLPSAMIEYFMEIGLSNEEVSYLIEQLNL